MSGLLRSAKLINFTSLEALSIRKQLDEGRFAFVVIVLIRILLMLVEIK